MKNDELDDAALVARAAEGDCDAFAAIVERYKLVISSLTLSATGNIPKSEELAHEVFVTAWTRLKALRDPAGLKKWLYGIARNHVRNFHRTDRLAKSRTKPLTEEVRQAPDAAPNDAVIKQEEANLVREALHNLPPKYREPLVLFYREHDSIEEVAAALDLSQAAARQRLVRGRRLLKAEVMSVVERTLRRSAPGAAFTAGVLATLSLISESAAAGASHHVAEPAACKPPLPIRFASRKGVSAAVAIAAAFAIALWLNWGGSAAPEGSAPGERPSDSPASLAESRNEPGGTPGTPHEPPVEAASVEADNEEPNRPLEQLSPIERMRALYRESNALRLDGEYAEAMDGYAALEELARTHENTYYVYQSYRRRARIYVRQGEPLRAIELYETALPHVRETTRRIGESRHADEWNTLLAIRRQHIQRGASGAARMAFWRAEASAIEYFRSSDPDFRPSDLYHLQAGHLDELPDKPLVAFLAIARAQSGYLNRGGDPEGSLQLMHDVRELLENRDRTNRMRRALGGMYYRLGVRYDVLEQSDKSEAMFARAAEVGTSHHRDVMEYNQLWKRFQQGEDPAPLIDELREEIAYEKEKNATLETILIMESHLPIYLAAAGKVEEALELVDDVVRRAEESGLASLTAQLRVSRAQTRMRCDVLEGVEKDLFDAIDFFRRNGLTRHEGRAYLDYARYLTLNGDLEEAGKMFQLAIERAERLQLHLGHRKRTASELELWKDAVQRRGPDVADASNGDEAATGDNVMTSASPQSPSPEEGFANEELARIVTGSVDLQPLKMISRVAEGELVRGRFTLFNPGLSPVGGTLSIDAPVEGDHWNAERGVRAIGIGDSGQPASYEIELEPGERQVIYLEAGSTANGNTALAHLRWDGEPLQESWWSFDTSGEAESVSVVQASLAMENPFYSVPLYHEIYYRAEPEGIVDLRVRTDHPAHIELLDTATGRIIGLDSSGNGQFDGVGDALIRDANRNGYPDLFFTEEIDVGAIEIHVYPQHEPGQPTPDEIAVWLDLRQEDREWQVHAENHLLSAQ